MIHAPLRAGALTLIALLAVACGSGAPSAAQSGTPSAAPSAVPSAGPATYADFDAAFCGSFTALIRAVGNPDAGTPSVLSRKLDDAVAAGDALGAEQAAAAMLRELESGRAEAGAAARWQPAAATMAQMDRLLAAFEAMTVAKRAAAAHAPGGADPQRAFEAAGGVEAWSAVIGGVSSLPLPSGAVPQPCPALQGKA
jgi:hypothetical protein